MTKIINTELLLNILNDAIKKLYKDDIYLIEYESSERSIIGSLQSYLKSDTRLSEYDINNEYNREWRNGAIKRDYDGSPNTADLLIHTRWDTSVWNLLYLEAKTYFNVSEAEKQKDMQTIRYSMGRYNYNYWIFICFNKLNVDYVLLHAWEIRTWVFNIR